jgi:hypothetical protein
MNTLEINNAVIDAIGEQYPDKGLFDKHFNIALNRVPKNAPKDLIISIMVTYMQSMLNDYANTSAKTKGGKVARFFASIGSKILPFIKIKR